MKKVFACSAILTKFETRVDKSNKITVNTQEITSDQRAALSELTGDYGLFAFLEEGANLDQLAGTVIIPENIGDKSPSQRLRSVLYRVWESQKSPPPFDTYYDREMERIITHYKEKLS